MAEHYDVIITGTGARGGTLAHALAGSGKRILLLERGNFLPSEPRPEPGELVAQSPRRGDDCAAALRKSRDYGPVTAGARGCSPAGPSQRHGNGSGEENAMARYPSITDHGLIGDLQTAALVATDGLARSARLNHGAGQVTGVLRPQ